MARSCWRNVPVGVECGMFPSMSAPHVHVIGASGRSGAALAQILGPRIVPVVRDAAKWHAQGFAVPPKVADLADPAAMARALLGATHRSEERRGGKERRSR